MLSATAERTVRGPRLSEAVVRRLKACLDPFTAQAPYRSRIAFDPVEFPHRYTQGPDIEVSGLLAASLAYGRADLFRQKLDSLLTQMGPSPAQYVFELSLPDAKRLLDGFVYRFNVGPDLAVLLFGMRRALRAYGSLEALFRKQLDDHPSFHSALSGFTRELRKVPMAPIRRALGRERGLNHLLPSPVGAGAAKRLNLFLRWMVRGPDEVDFGIWRSISPSDLMIPLDTHIGRLARHLRLTRRKDLSWKTAEEITLVLRRLDATDPVRYDFTLCHHGMSGACPITPSVENCRRCALLPACRTGPRLLRRRVGSISSGG